MKENPLSLQLKLEPEDFLPASKEEKESQIIMRESVSFWKDGVRRLAKKKPLLLRYRKPLLQQSLCRHRKPQPRQSLKSAQISALPLPEPIGWAMI